MNVTATHGQPQRRFESTGFIFQQQCQGGKETRTTLVDQYFQRVRALSFWRHLGRGSCDAARDYPACCIPCRSRGIGRLSMRRSSQSRRHIGRMMNNTYVYRSYATKAYVASDVRACESTCHTLPPHIRTHVQRHLRPPSPQPCSLHAEAQVQDVHSQMRCQSS